MARIRTIKPDFFTSPDTAAVDFPVRIFYAALWCWADDFGIGETNLNGLLGHAFPDSDGFTAQDVRNFCADCAQHYGIVFYTVRGRHYFAIPSWEKHQKLEKREERRKYPSPDDPDATPDLRFQPRAVFAPEDPRRSGADCALEREGEREGELKEPPYPPEREPSPRQPITSQTGAGKALIRFDRQLNRTARSAPAHAIAVAYSGSLDVPIESGMLAEVGVEIDKCLTSGIPPTAIAAGLQEWTASPSFHPSQIPKYVHKAANGRKPNGIGKPTQKAMGYDDAASQLLAELGVTQ